MTAVAWSSVVTALQTWVANGLGLPGSSVIWGQQAGPRPPDPWCLLNVTTIKPTGLDDWRTPTVDNFITFVLGVATVTPGANTITIPGHGLSTGDGAGQVASSGSIPSGLLASADYWAIVLDPNTIQLATTLLGAVSSPAVPVPILDAGSGSITFTADAHAVRCGQEVTRTWAGVRDASLTIAAYSRGIGGTSALAILDQLRAARMLPAQQAILSAASIGVHGLGTVQDKSTAIANIGWESRATVDLGFYVSSAVSIPDNYVGSTTGAGTYSS